MASNATKTALWTTLPLTELSGKCLVFPEACDKTDAQVSLSLETWDTIWENIPVLDLSGRRINTQGTPWGQNPRENISLLDHHHTSPTFFLLPARVAFSRCLTVLLLNANPQVTQVRLQLRVTLSQHTLATSHILPTHGQSTN